METVVEYNSIDYLINGILLSKSIVQWNVCLKLDVDCYYPNIFFQIKIE